MRQVLVFLVFTALAASTAGWAQYGRRRGPVAATANSGPYNGPAVTFQGTLKALTKKEMVVDLDTKEPTDERQTLTFRLSKKTKFLKEDKEIKAADIAAGTHLSIEATRDGDQKLSALNVVAGVSAAR